MKNNRKDSSSHNDDVQPFGRFFTRPRLKALKSVTTWGGVVVTISGIVLSAANGSDLRSVGLSFFGVLLTCSGHLIAARLAKHDAAERQEQKEWLDELESRLQKSEAEAESASYYFQEQIESVESRLRDFSMRHDDPVDRD